MLRKLAATWLVGSLLVILSVPTANPTEAPFYEGKTLRILVSSGTGGGTDTAARLVSRFMGKYLPGNPKVLVQNMPGGGGTIANNYCFNEIKP
jgi:tripartite-type tricarboxylate transporter receptor subunit TctC